MQNIRYSEGAERVRNIPYREDAQCVKMPLHIPLKALWGQNRDGGDEVRRGYATAWVARMPWDKNGVTLG